MPSTPLAKTSTSILTMCLNSRMLINKEDLWLFHLFIRALRILVLGLHDLSIFWIFLIWQQKVPSLLWAELGWFSNLGCRFGRLWCWLVTGSRSTTILAGFWSLTQSCLWLQGPIDFLLLHHSSICFLFRARTTILDCYLPQPDHRSLLWLPAASQAYIATGDNRDMAKSFGINDTREVGLVTSNGYRSLRSLISQQDGCADVSSD